MRTILLAVLILLAGCAETPGAMPRVEYADRTQIADVVCGGDEDACKNVVAGYVAPARTMYLPETFDVRRDYDASLLIHEFVHHVQALSGRVYRCRQEMEREAYAAQIAFLKARGHAEPLKVMGMNELMLAMVTNCIDGQ